MKHDASTPVDVTAQHIGGITDTSVSLSAGVNVLVGRNATNRTSFLEAIMAASGSTAPSLKSDADEGEVELTIGDETYTRLLTRSNGGVQYGGDPYLDDPTVADLFAFLLESNEARQAVVRRDDLRDVIMRPVDTDRIHAEIDELEAEKRRLDDDLDELADFEDQLPELEQERQHLESRLETKQEALAETNDEIEALDAEVDESRADKSELEAKLDDLSSTRNDLENIRYDLDTQRERLQTLREQHEEQADALAELPEMPAGRISEVDDEIAELRQRKQDIEGEINEIQNVIQFNESRLKEESTDALAALDGGTDDRESVTDQLLEDDTVSCWTCGSTVETEQVEKTIDRLRELSQRKLGDVSSAEDKLAELQSEKRTLERQQREREQLERKLERTEREIEETEEAIDDLETKKTTLQSAIEELEAEVETLEQKEHEEVLERHREANQLEFDIGRLQSDIADVTDEIETIEARLDERSRLESEREEIQSDLTELRTRIDRLEAESVEAFNEHVATVLDLLDYANIERIWIERVEREVREGRRKVTKTMFELHVVRSSESGSAYEDTIDNLSESEREVTGLIFALAGYLTHDVYEDCPFMLLDSLEAIDSVRIAELVEYFADYAPYLVVALLPEDATGVDADRRIESI